MFSSLRVALVHDWLTGMRGGEKVLEVFAEMFPDAPIYTMLHKPGSVSKTIESHEIRTSALQRIPGAVNRYRHFLPIMPRLVEQMRVEPVDLLLSCSSCVAKSILPPPGATNASYILSPMRYIYDRYDDYFSPSKAGLATRVAMRCVRGSLQRWDIRTASRVEHLCGISTFIGDRIQRLYNRECSIIHPPVEAKRFASALREPEDYYVMVTALVPYKNVEIAIEAFRLLDRRLIIAGSGPMEARLRAIAPPNVTMLGWVEDEEIPNLVAGARAFLMPNVEDFGIAPVEAMSAGRPVIAFGQGGVRDTIRDLDRWRAGRLTSPFGGSEASIHRLPTGLFFHEMTPESLADAVLRFEAEMDVFQPSAIAAWAEEFSTPKFRRKIASWVSEMTGVVPKTMAA